MTEKKEFFVVEAGIDACLGFLILEEIELLVSRFKLRYEFRHRHTSFNVIL